MYNVVSRRYISILVWKAQAMKRLLLCMCIYMYVDQLLVQLQCIYYACTCVAKTCTVLSLFSQSSKMTNLYVQNVHTCTCTWYQCLCQCFLDRKRQRRTSMTYLCEISLLLHTCTMYMWMRGILQSPFTTTIHIQCVSHCHLKTSYQQPWVQPCSTFHLNYTCMPLYTHQYSAPMDGYAM